MQSQLNITACEKHLTVYWDKQILDLLEFGFPLDFDRKAQIKLNEFNHKSAVQFQDQVDKYIQEELSFQAICGPFKEKTSRLSRVPYQDSDKRRTLIDLSWTHDASVNTGVSKYSYLNTYFTLTYPSIDTIVERIKQLRAGAKLCKLNISKAFRQLTIDSRDIDL